LGAGEPIILLHGFAANADLNWRLPGLTRALAQEFRVVAMDLRGHGRSAKPHETARYGMEMLHDVIRLMDHLQLEKVHLVGYSLGGFITLKFAATYSQRLITASPLGAGWERPNESEFLDALQKMAAALESGSGIGPVSRGLGGRREKPTWAHTLWVKVLSGYFNDRHALSAMIKGLPSLQVAEAELRALTIPVCSIVGAIDPQRVGAEAMVGVVPHLIQIIVPQADHIRAPMSEMFHQGLLSFLRRHSNY